MRGPQINPVGILETPEDYHARPRTYSGAARVSAAILIGAFLLVSLTTSVFSLAAYCLTSYAGVPFPLEP